MAKPSISKFSIRFLMSVCFAYIIIGFLNPVLDSTLAIIIAPLIVMTIANVIVYLSLRDTGGRVATKWRIETKWQCYLLNSILALSPPVFFITTIYIGLQFPEMFVWEYISIPSQYFLTFI